MQCVICATENPPEATFCSHCGAVTQAEEPQQSARFCTGCGTPFISGTTYCVNCGSTIQVSGAKGLEAHQVQPKLEYIGLLVSVL